MLESDTDSFSQTGIYAKDFEEQPQANLRVFGVYVVIRLCRIVDIRIS